MNKPKSAGADRFAAMEAFVAVAEHGSFVAAASALDVSASSLSRKVAHQEAKLGCRLFNRTTRQVVLSEVGETYLRNCRSIIEQTEAADAAVSAYALEPTGTLRIGLPSLYGQLRIAPYLPLFLQQYPKIALVLNFDDRYADLIEHRLDVAVRIGNDLPSEYIARKLAPNPRYICASPDYLSRRGTPRRPHDVSAHDCLHFGPLAEQRRWRLSRNGRNVEPVIHPIMTSDNAEALRLGAVAGLGLALLAEFVIDDDLKAGRLVSVLSDWTVAESTIFAVYPDAQYLPLKTRAFIDFLANEVYNNSNGSTL